MGKCVNKRADGIVEAQYEWPLDPVRVLSIDSRTRAIDRFWLRRHYPIHLLADQNTESLLRNFPNHVFLLIPTLG